MSRYIWFNPVSMKMVGDRCGILDELLFQRGYERLEAPSQAGNVLNMYKQYAKISERTVLDCRCPMVRPFLEQAFPQDQLNFPDIPPILIQTARYLYDNHIHDSSDSLTIVAPCQSLCMEGTSYFAGKVNFFTWIEFVRQEGIALPVSLLEQSPLPLGFFDPLALHLEKASGEAQIRATVAKAQSAAFQMPDLVEMLYCQGGCNNGDGVI